MKQISSEIMIEHRLKEIQVEDSMFG